MHCTFTGFSSLTSTTCTSLSKREAQSSKILCKLLSLNSMNATFTGFPSNKDGKPKLKDAFKELFPLATDWKIIGGLLGLEKHVLNKIKAEEEGVRNCLYEMLSEWLKQVHPTTTWAALADAVETVDEHKAAEIRERNASPL